ncbi:hypothetical protein RchiOBHm_Chr2g0138771 [Rosa chinensis]|uniref:Uncharacterized protein n=1 Tax=Rosa chinensis TaxID=74649 RepID=A0A2P6RWY5_ROSCH|nr:hypothetical protein RchiOBHm_Chr2g0138771 [Rosa chinensis]
MVVPNAFLPFSFLKIVFGINYMTHFRISKIQCSLGPLGPQLIHKKKRVIRSSILCFFPHNFCTNRIFLLSLPLSLSLISVFSFKSFNHPSSFPFILFPTQKPEILGFWDFFYSHSGIW